MNEPSFPLAGKRIWVAGHQGMVGSAVLRRLREIDCGLVTVPRSHLDLTRQSDVETWMADEKPQVVVVAAAKVGGILANARFPAAFIYTNLAIEMNIIEAARSIGVEKLLFLGSSCVYPRLAAQPISEDALLSGPLEPTNEWYAIAKIAGIKLCQAYRQQYGCDFISAMPTNLYGPGDSYDLETAHVVPALIRKCHEAKTDGRPSVEIWGTGSPLRDFLFVDDLADALVFLLEHYSGDVAVNIGSGAEISIKGLAELIGRVTEFEGGFTFDRGKPDGTPRKRLDSSFLSKLGWTGARSLEEGLRRTYEAYLMEQGETGTRVR